MPDGRLIWLEQSEIDAFFQYHGLDSRLEGPSGIQYFKGIGKPWTKDATPNSIYTQFDPRTGQSQQTALYDPSGDVLAHIDWKHMPPATFTISQGLVILHRDTALVARTMILVTLWTWDFRVTGMCGHRDLMSLFHT
jgi:hypothetical protein